MDGLEGARPLEMETSADALATLGAGDGAGAEAVPANRLAIPAKADVAAEAAATAVSVTPLSPPIRMGS